MLYLLRNEGKEVSNGVILIDNNNNKTNKKKKEGKIYEFDS